MNKIKIENQEYELIKNYKEAFNEEEFKEKYTDYFYDYDYIIADIAYGKVRLKGFYDKENPKVKSINNYELKDEYLKNNCAVDCKYYILKKVK